MRELLSLNPRLILSSVVVFLGLVIAMVPENTTQPYKLSPQKMLEEVQFGTEMIHPDHLAHWLVNEDPSIRLIDVRTPEEYEAFHLPGALNIPFNSILSPEFTPVVDQGVKMNILYSNGSTTAQEAWMILRQLGYENNYVLQGGLNYWVDVIMDPDAPETTSPDDELAKYDFRKGAGQFFGGGAAIEKTAPADKPIEMPTIKRRDRKKPPQGGC